MVPAKVVQLLKNPRGFSNENGWYIKVTTTKNKINIAKIVLANIFNICGEFSPKIILNNIIIGPKISRSITHTIPIFNNCIGKLEFNLVFNLFTLSLKFFILSIPEYKNIIKNNIEEIIII